MLNKLEIARTAYCAGSGDPLLPGSSIKGAIRTAVLDSIRKRSRQQFPLSDSEAAKSHLASKIASAMEEKLLGGSFSTDPMRLVKIADAFFLPGNYTAKNAQGVEIERVRQARSILFQTNRKKRPNQFEARGKIQTLLECVPANQPRAFRTTLVIENKVHEGKGGLSLSDLVQACNDFYLERFELEVEMLASNKYVSDVWIKNARTRLADNGIWGKSIREGTGFLLRIGRHSGAESVTVDAPRKIKIMKDKGNKTWEREATTVWLASNTPSATGGMWPFGWVFVQKT